QDQKPPQIEHVLAGFSEETVRALSAARGEPEWMLELRLAAWRTFEELPWPKPTDEAWRRTQLTGFNLEKFSALPLPGQDREQTMTRIQQELDEMDSAASLVFQDGEAIYRDETEKLAEKGVIFTDLRTAVLEH